jgi:antitoxin ParD1/3/4
MRVAPGVVRRDPTVIIDDSSSDDCRWVTLRRIITWYESGAVAPLSRTQGAQLMSVQVAPEIEAMIREKVSAGRYGSADEVLREALQALEERDRLQDLRASLVRAKEQVARGEFVEWSPDFMDQLSQEADELTARGYEPKPDVCP